MFNIKGIDHININVKNIEETKAFYKEWFNFDVIKEYTYESEGKEIKFALIGISGVAMLCLYEGRYEDGGYSNIGHLGFNVSNFEEAYTIAKSKNLILEKWGLVEYENSKSFYIADPNGFELEVSQVFTGGH